MSGFATRLVGNVRQLLDLPLSFMGLAFFRSWLSLLTSQELLSGLNEQVHDIGLAAMLVALALCAPRLAPLICRRGAIALGTACALFVSAAALALSASGGAASSLGVLAAAGTALASSLFILMWCELYCSLDITRAALSLALATVGAEALNLLLEGMSEPYRQAALFVLPCLCSLTLLRARSLVAFKTGRASSVMRFKVPWKLIGLIALYYLASGICMGIAGTSNPWYGSAANAISGVVLLVAVVIFSQTFDLATACTSPALLLMPALLLLPFVGTSQNDIAAICTALSVAVFQLAVFLIMCDISRRHGIPAMLLFGLEEATVAFRSVGLFAGSHGESLAATGIPVSTVAVACVALTIIATLLLFNKQELAEAWGVGLFGPGKMAHDAQAFETLRAACDTAAKAHGLTPRECEVLCMLARGATIKEMCDELNIARGTVKAHCEHIYTKMGVRSKKELSRMLGAK